MKPLERLGQREADIVEQRTRDGYGTGELGNFAALEDVLRSLINTLVPNVPPSIDLAAFVDANVGIPLGRGDRPAGSLAERDLFRSGLESLAEAGFADLKPAEQLQLVSRMRNGKADAELGVDAKLFVDRLLEKALIGYLAHPLTWERIGFTGPAFPEGYAWIGPAEVLARRDRKAGWKSL